jgi:hypothetical protein
VYFSLSFYSVIKARRKRFAEKGESSKMYGREMLWAEKVNG